MSRLRSALPLLLLFAVPVFLTGCPKDKKAPAEPVVRVPNACQPGGPAPAVPAPQQQAWCLDNCGSSGCGYCCDNAALGAACRTACASRSIMATPADLADALGQGYGSEIFSLIPSDILASLAAHADIGEELVAFYAAMSWQERVITLQVLSTVPPETWQAIRNNLNIGLSRWWPQVNRYAATWGMNPANFETRFLVYWTWLFQYLTTNDWTIGRTAAPVAACLPGEC